MNPDGQPMTGVGMIRDMVAYQRQTAKTAIYPAAGDPASIEALSYVALGLVGEAGELANKVKKIIRDDSGHIGDTARAQLADELGDTLWYLAQFANQLDVNLDAVAHGNLAKLADRKRRGVLHGSGLNR